MGCEVFLDGEFIGTFYGVEQFFSYSGPLWGGTVQYPNSGAELP